MPTTEVSLLVAVQADLGYDLNLVIGEVMPRFSAHSQQSVLKASSVTPANNCSGFVAPPFHQGFALLS